MKLTKRLCEGAEYTGHGNARCVHWCEDPRGFGLRIFPSGRKSWVLSYRTPGGTKRLHTLGDYAVLSLDRARLDAKAELVKVEREDADPVAEKESRRVELTTGTVAALVDEYLTARARDPVDPLGSVDSQRALALQRLAGNKIGARPWKELSRAEVREWHGRLAATPYRANRALSLLRAAINWRLAQEAGRGAHEATRKDFNNPAVGVRPFPEKPRQVVLSVADAGRFDAAIEKATTDPYQRAYFRFLRDTGCRRSEALGLRWEDVTLTGKTSVATFRDTKNGTDRTVSLALKTAKGLKALRRVEDNPHVFVGHREGEPLVGIDKTWRKIRTAIGRPDLRIHDIRRSFGSWLGDASFSSKQIGTVLGHKSSVTSTTYMALSDVTRRGAADKIQQLIAATRRKSRPKKVTA